MRLSPRPVLGFGVLQWLNCLSAFRPSLRGKSAMAKTPAREQQVTQHAGARQRRRSAGIYGSIVTAAILAAAGDYLRTGVLAVSVVVTLLVYWIAEEYAELLGEQVEDGRLPTWRRVRDAMASTWPMVSASFAPLLALVLARVAGASGPDAANVGLAAAVVLLMFHAWSAGHASHLRGRQLATVTCAAAVLGLVMVALKNLVLVHLH